MDKIISQVFSVYFIVQRYYNYLLSFENINSKFATELNFEKKVTMYLLFKSSFQTKELSDHDQLIRFRNVAKLH